MPLIVRDSARPWSRTIRFRNGYLLLVRKADDARLRATHEDVLSYQVALWGRHVSRVPIVETELQKRL